MSLVVTPLPACVATSSSTDVDAGTTALTSKTTGTGCGTDCTTGVTLCVGTNDCPNLSVDQSTFPECGFYFTGGGVYLTCLCSNYLCPIGEPATCDKAESLLNATNEGTVCGQYSSGKCTEVSTKSTCEDAGSDEASEAASSCDESCASMCAGVPDCIQLCGC